MRFDDACSSTGTGLERTGVVGLDQGLVDGTGGCRIVYGGAGLLQC